jgi:hypothetical protein
MIYRRERNLATLNRSCLPGWRHFLQFVISSALLATTFANMEPRVVCLHAKGNQIHHFLYPNYLNTYQGIYSISFLLIRIYSRDITVFNSGDGHPVFPTGVSWNLHPSRLPIRYSVAILYFIYSVMVVCLTTIRPLQSLRNTKRWKDNYTNLDDCKYNSELTVCSRNT